MTERDWPGGPRSKHVNLGLMDYKVRPAGPDDAPGMGVVNTRAWQVGYVGLLPQDFLDARDPQARADFWCQELAAADPLRRNLVAVCEGEVMGFASFGRFRVTAPEAGVGELTVLNVRPDRWSTGVGSALLAAVHSGLAELGFPVAVLWVISGNTRARRFYERHGWQADGGHEVFGDTVKFDQLRYRRAVP
jgi:GNAT superfamily N-acetyltransferase